MTSYPWKEFVENLAEKGFDSPYLERLRSKLPSYANRGERAQRQIEQEILHEKASALGRAGEKVDLALLELDVIARELEQAASSERPEKIVAFNAQREVALHALWELKVHREALGLRRHDGLAQYYPVPPKRT